MAPSRCAAIRRLLVLAVILGGLYAVWHYAAAPTTRTTAGPGVGAAPIPVTVANGKKADFPVYLNGLGTVQPYQTVTVRSRVDGQIIKVDFKQGRMVNEGDVLVEIDPRPYQAALDQTLAKKAKDEANLSNARRDLARYTSLAQKDAASRQQVETQQATVDQLTTQSLATKPRSRTPRRNSIIRSSRPPCPEEPAFA
jgi:multidrug efflux system membrane fusion protein